MTYMLLHRNRQFSLLSIVCRVDQCYNQLRNKCDGCLRIIDSFQRVITVKTTNLIFAETLAIDGGPQAFAQQHGRRQPKIGVEEFMSIAERFGFSDESL